MSVEFRKHFNLQNGEKCFVTDDKLIVTSDYKIIPDNFIPNRGKGYDLKKIRLVVNIFFTLLVFVVAFYFGLYPLILLMFLILWDIKQIQRYNLPISNTRCIDLDWIEKVNVRKGNLGFNYIDLIFENSQGKTVMLPLKIYDSDEEFEVAIKTFEKLGHLDSNSHKVALGKEIEGESFKVNNRSEIVFNDKGIYFTKDGRYDESNPDAFGLKVTLFSLITTICLVLFGVQIWRLYTEGFNYPGLVLSILVLLVTIIPLKRVRRSRASFIPKSALISFKKINNYNASIEYKIGGISFFRKFSVLNYPDFEKISKRFSEFI